jgi:hypothetical protein
MSTSEAAQALTDDEVVALAQKTATFAEGLTPREREAFSGILKAAEGAPDEDVQGYANPILVRVAAQAVLFAIDKGALDAIDFKAIEQKLKEQQQQKGKPPA